MVVLLGKTGRQQVTVRVVPTYLEYLLPRVERKEETFVEGKGRGVQILSLPLTYM